LTARIGVVLFPGTNCEQDVCFALEQLGAAPEILWHGDRTTKGVDAIVVPGGFAHGDYLRTGAIARFSPVMDAVADAAGAGMPVVGVCNGFQVLTEAHLLPGALQKNAGLKFLCETVAIRVETASTALTNQTRRGEVLRIPINHFEGNYVCPAETLAELRADDRIVFRYVDNPNGSVDDIAGICNAGRNVVGMMPHPERASDPILGSADGVVLLRSLLAAAAGAGRPEAEAEAEDSEVARSA
jgi:phosphoribosylformylglycinamidine synthase